MADPLPDGAEALLLPVTAGTDGDGVEPREGAVQAAVRYGIDFGDLAERSGAGGAPGDATSVVLPRPHGATQLPWTGLPDRLAFIGVGDRSPAALRRAGAAVSRVTRGLGPWSPRSPPVPFRAASGLRRGLPARRLPPPHPRCQAQPAGPGAGAGAARRRRGGRPPGRGRRSGELDRAGARGHAVGHQEPRVAGRACHRARPGRRPRGRGARREGARRAGLRRAARRRVGLGHPAAAGPGDVPARGGAGRAARPSRRGRQGHHVRHRRPVDQAAHRHGLDEDRHDRRRGGARHGARRRGGAGPARGHGPAGARGERRRRRPRTGPATSSPCVAAPPSR